jgi:hypothetical protein
MYSGLFQYVQIVQHDFRAMFYFWVSVRGVVTGTKPAKPEKRHVEVSGHDEMLQQV